jgi:TfoX/Sxy family transcriptional regulator of competence genes
LACDPKTLQKIMASAAPDLEILFRPMFGVILAYVGGRPLAALSGAGLALKVFGADQAALLTLEGAAKWRYDARAPLSKSYVVVPAEMLQDARKLRSWILRAAAGLPAVTPRTRRR